jgi:hypothetical protein
VHTAESEEVEYVTLMSLPIDVPSYTATGAEGALVSGPSPIDVCHGCGYV